LQVLLNVIVKELLQLRRDTKMLRMVFGAPIIQLVILGFAVNTDVRRIPTVLVDQDRSAESRDLVDRFVRSDYFELVAVEEQAQDVDRWLVRGDAQAALIIGTGFARDIHSGRVPAIQLVADGSDSSSTMVVLGYASRIISEKSVEILADRLAQIVAEVGSIPAGRIELVSRIFYNPNLSSRWFYVPAVLALILMLMTMILTAMGVVREKEIGTMEQLIVTPIRSWQLILGKLIPFAAIGLVQILLVTSVAVFGFRVPVRGSFWLLLFLSQIFILNTLGLGLLVSTVVRTQQQAMMTAAFTMMLPMILLSGLIFPIENMPRFMQLVTYVIPLRYYATIIRGIFLKGAGISVLWPEALTLLFMGSAILALAAMRFRKRLD
jgi:ABC-2 type transport system permease protein